jgi:hypothetical protein
LPPKEALALGAIRIDFGAVSTFKDDVTLEDSLTVLIPEKNANQGLHELFHFQYYIHDIISAFIIFFFNFYLIYGNK